MHFTHYQITAGKVFAVCPTKKPTEKDFYIRHSDGWNWGDYANQQRKDFETWLSTQPTLHTNAPDGVYPVGEFGEVVWQVWRPNDLYPEWTSPAHQDEWYKEQVIENGCQVRDFLSYIGPKKQEWEALKTLMPCCKKCNEPLIGIYETEAGICNYCKRTTVPATPEQKGVDQGEEKSKWIDINSELKPALGEKVLVHRVDGVIHVDIFTAFHGGHTDFLYKVTHWMPLPKPPTI